MPISGRIKKYILKLVNPSNTSALDNYSHPRRAYDPKPPTKHSIKYSRIVGSRSTDVWESAKASISKPTPSTIKTIQRMNKMIMPFAALLTGCGLRQIDAPAPDEHERWDKPGATIESTQKDLRECTLEKTASFENLRILDECMLGKGYEFIDPVRGRKKCDSPRMTQLPSCKSLK
ncbi:hypothetical protein ABGV17_09480 [Guyparkeria sp. GHLCS8-2]|uniref:hypothetical protein n=1 Tax=Guyparkeria halopsychrophila TaxID=3139421 RepID=UPI0037CC8CA6